MRTPWLRAISTARSMSTFAPEAAISSISSYETCRELAGLGDDARVGGEDAGDVRVDLARGAEGGGEGDGGRIRAAAAERRHVHRVAREALEARDEDDLPVDRAPRATRTGVISRIFAFVWTGSVMIPACEPVNETAS